LNSEKLIKKNRVDPIFSSDLSPIIGTKKYGWVKIDYVKAGQILSRGTIAEKIWQVVQKVL